MTLTVENIPAEIDKALRQRAKSEGRSVDQVIVDVIKAGLTADKSPVKKRDRDHLTSSRKIPAAETLRQLNKKMDRDPERIMRLAEANARRIAGKSHL